MVTLSTQEAMDRIGVKKRDTLYGIVGSGQLRAIRVRSKLGGRPRYRFDPVDIDQYLESAKTPGPQPALGKRKTPALAGVESIIDRSRRIILQS